MTGHVGERINRLVALMTDDFVLYHRLAPMFQARGVALLGLRPDQAVPESVRALLDGPSDDPRSIAVREDDDATWIAAMTRVDGRALRRAVIGIDPGETTGLALLVDGLVYLTGEAHDPEAAAMRVAAWASGLDVPVSLHVGDGAPRLGHAIRREVRKCVQGIEISTVSEHRSTPISAATGSRHMDAAIHIAMRTP